MEPSLKDYIERSAAELAGNLCPLCRDPEKPINKNDPDNWKQVIGWVGGPKKDSMRLREDTGKLAHNECVKRLSAGQAPDQPTLEEEMEDDGERRYISDDELPI